MNINFRFVLTIASFAFATWLPSEITAAELKEAQVTQVIQDVRLLPSNASPRPATVNDNVRQGTAVQTGVQSRSELTFKDQTITRLGEKTIFSVGQGARTIELGSGQFLLYVPKNSGGAKIKMGPVTAAITGTTVLGNVAPSGIVQFTVLEGSSCINLPGMGQSLFVQAGQMVVYDPVYGRLENPVEVDLQQQLSSPLVKDFRQLPSAGLIDEAIQNQHLAAASDEDLENAVRAAGAASIRSATPEQFMQAFNSLIARSDPRAVNLLVARAARARPDLAPRIAVAAVTGLRPVGGGYARGYAKGYAKDFKGKEISCDQVQSIVNAAIAADPWMADEIIDAVIQAAPMLADCIQRCPPTNAFVPPYVISP